MKIELNSFQFELVMTALCEKHNACPANIPAKKNYKDMIDYMKSWAKKH